MNKERNIASKTKADFQKKWSLDKLNDLTKVDYVSNGKKDGFCYDIEHNTPGIGSMRGGSSLKFGLYRRASNKEEVKAKNVCIDPTETYVWKNIVAEDVDSAFEKVKQKLIEIVEAAQTGDLKKIDEVKAPFFWPVFKWKIAFMYAPEGTMVDIFSKSALSSYSNNMLGAHKKILEGYSKDESIWNYSSKIWAEISKNNSAVKKAEIDKFESNDEDEAMLKTPLNQILFGPPGTGKTFNTINKAISIIENRDISGEENRNDLQKKFDEYRKTGQIEFVTFHQSYGYEEFVEGIKAKTSDHGIEYKIESGIFKKLCDLASETESISVRTEDSEQQLTRERFKELYSTFVTSLPDYSEHELSEKSLKTEGGNEFFLYKNSTPSIVVRSLNGTTAMSISHKKLERVIFESEIPTYASYEQIIIDKIFKIKIERKHVLIIDEINRGNISKVFGELITFIESSKCIGKDEELKVKLPYSGELFGVPQNLYIIGTMNTADRSIAPIDTALRRRFEFEEMLPKPELLSTNIEDINLQELLTAINARIEYLYDRDHTIGHSYLMDVTDLASLRSAFKNKVIPLLAEYFYEDWENIDLVLNKNGFIQEKKNENDYIKDLGNQIQGKKVYKINDYSKWEPWQFEKIYNDKAADPAKIAVTADSTNADTENAN